MRYSKITRKTKETDIVLELDLDKQGSSISTGIGFFDHMLEQVAKHGNLYLNVNCKGDLNVDGHHTVEDVGICFGLALKEALGTFSGINRYGSATTPMDEALVSAYIDICNRPNASIDQEFKRDIVGDFATEMVVEFFKAVAFNSGLNIHTVINRNGNDHHVIEAMFKSFARALKEAVTKNDLEILSTKGVL